MARAKAPAFVEQLRTALNDGLKRAGIPASVAYEHVGGTNLYRFWVLASQFDKLPQYERQDLVWRIAQSTLSAANQLLISMIVTMTPEEAGDMPDIRRESRKRRPAHSTKT